MRSLGPRLGSVNRRRGARWVAGQKDPGPRHCRDRERRRPGLEALAERGDQLLGPAGAALRVDPEPALEHGRWTIVTNLRREDQRPQVIGHFAIAFAAHAVDPVALEQLLRMATQLAPGDRRRREHDPVVGADRLSREGGLTEPDIMECDENVTRRQHSPERRLNATRGPALGEDDVEELALGGEAHGEAHSELVARTSHDARAFGIAEPMKREAGRGKTGLEGRLELASTE